MTRVGNVLDQILTNLRKNSALTRPSLFVFDLDSTLLDVSPRIQQILNDFITQPEIQKLYPREAALLANDRVHWRDWGVHSLLERVGFGSPAHPLHQLAHHHWYKHFFSNDYLKYDRPYEGAVDFVNMVLEHNCKVIYLTGRDTDRMGEGTLLSLEQHNFPLNQKNSSLVLKPHKSLADDEFKRDWFLSQALTDHHDVWFFENEPQNIRALRQQAPQVNIVFFDSTHSGKADAPADLPKIQNYLVSPSR